VPVELVVDPEPVEYVVLVLDPVLSSFSQLVAVVSSAVAANSIVKMVLLFMAFCF
jgi:hypothetical protein